VKVIPFILFVSLCGNTQIALGQDNILFVYIGTAKGDYDSVLVTTADPYAESSKGLEGRHTYKIIGAAPYPLYIHGRDCFMLFKSTLEHLLWKGPDRRKPGSGITMGFPVACNAMSHLIIQCHEEFLHRNQYVAARPKDTFRIPNEPPRITFIYP
jgi:hypothetical protein